MLQLSVAFHQMEKLTYFIRKMKSAGDTLHFMRRTLSHICRIEFGQFPFISVYKSSECSSAVLETTDIARKYKTKELHEKQLMPTGNGFSLGEILWMSICMKDISLKEGKNVLIKI